MNILKQLDKSTRKVRRKAGVGYVRKNGKKLAVTSRSRSDKLDSLRDKVISNRYGKALTLRTVKRIRKGKPVVTVKELRKEFQLTPTGKKQFKPVRDTAAAGLRATRKIKKATKDINYSSAVPNHW